LASRRRRRKSVGKVLVDVESRVRRVEKRPGATRLKSNVVTTQKIQARAIRTKTIATDAVTPNEADFGVTFVTDTEPTEFLKEGTTWVDPNTGAAAVYDPEAEDFVELTAIDYTARASADGKNTVYRQDYEPTGGTYVLGDVWFDTDDSNKLYRYSTAITATVTTKVLSGNFATLTVSAPHSFVVGETITVSGVDATFNGSYEVTATPTALTVRYAKTATNVPSASSSGTITNTAGWKGFALGDGALLNLSASKLTAGTIDASVITVSNLDAGNITTGTLTGRAISGGTVTGATIRTSASGRRVEMDASNDALSFYNAAGTALGHIRPATDSPGVIISSGGSATADFASSTHPKMLMYPIGTDGQFSLILNDAAGGFYISSTDGIQTATLGPTNTSTLVVAFSLREVGFAQSSVFPDLSSINTISGTEGQIVLTYS
jgi:hypothetical protein